MTLLVLHHPPLVEASPQPGPLLYLGELLGVADVAGGSPGPVDVPTLGTLPVLGTEQSLGLLCCC